MSEMTYDVFSATSQIHNLKCGSMFGDIYEADAKVSCEEFVWARPNTNSQY
jgi:hypothetical protein